MSRLKNYVTKFFMQRMIAPRNRIAYHIVKNQGIKINRQNVESNMRDVYKDQ